ncbi:DUF6402 family protein [Herbaspirillum frisingense]|uniref:DUF6402 family protein n=1 Tax=Herbaspirillum frisingense TaxID=92645 RepID=UPI0039AF032A
MVFQTATIGLGGPAEYTGELVRHQAVWKSRSWKVLPTMAKTRKIPYYKIAKARLPFSKPRWKCHAGFEGCIAINTPQTVSYERFAPGEVAPSSKSIPTSSGSTAGDVAAVRSETEHQKSTAFGKKQEPKEFRGQQFMELEAEDREKLPEFDLQDIPDAMDRMGWPMAAKLARKWFKGPAHVWDNDLDSVQPLEDKLVTLDWALRYGSVKKRLNNLLQMTGSKNAQAVLKRKLLRHASDTFQRAASTKPNLDLDTTDFVVDLRQFHLDWHFQKMEVSILDTTEGVLVLTDLSGALGNFVLYAAIGRAHLNGARYFKYDTDPQQFCMDASASVTHVYIYIKDNYSFNDKDPSRSQYLGHWNKRDMITSYYLAGNDIAGQLKPSLRRQNKNHNAPKENFRLRSDYLPGQHIVDKPVDTRRSLFSKFQAKDVYWPVYNRSYNEWRKARNRGEDFMIYSKPQLYKLETPIIIDLGTICRPYDITSKKP